MSANDHAGDSVREKIYGKYVSSGAFGAKPETVRDLAPRIPYLRRLVRHHFPPDRASAILDLGCGNGALLYVAAQEGYHGLSGVEYSAEQVEVARALGVPNVKQADLFAHVSEQASGTLDVVVTYDVIEHLTKQEIVKLAGEVHRVLRPGGRWIIHVPNGESPFVGRIRYGDITHELAFTRVSLPALLKSCSFGTVRCFEDVPAPHGFKSAVRYVLWKILRLPLRLWIMVETGEDSRDCIFSLNLLAVAWREGAAPHEMRAPHV
jgi:SAM-dependent methyltransferase